MKAIIESIMANRQALIKEHRQVAKFHSQVSNALEQVMLKMTDDNKELFEALWSQREEYQKKASELQTAINDLGNALNHLGYTTATFWG